MKKHFLTKTIYAKRSKFTPEQFSAVFKLEGQTYLRNNPEMYHYKTIEDKTAHVPGVSKVYKMEFREKIKRSKLSLKMANFAVRVLSKYLRSSK
jgi:hypothetical protein